jgi:tetratricopeptide (TPR) repeat protein
MRLDPHYPAIYLSWLGHAYRLNGQSEVAIAILQRAVKRSPNYVFPHLHLVVTYSDMNREKKARTEAVEVLRINPNFSVEGLGQILPFKNPAASEQYLAALRKAGLK